jgi:hypothetical protein
MIKTSVALTLNRGWNIAHSVYSFFRYAIFSLFELPLLQLYLYGPSVAGYGFWEGHEQDVVCATLTNVHSRHWAEHGDECAGLIYRRFEGYLILFYVTIYILTILSIYVLAVCRCFRCTG